MKKTCLFTSFISLLLFLLQFSCNRNLDSVTWPASDRNVITSFMGRILDEANAPLEGVTVTAGDKSTQTDINGNFRINNVRSSERFGCVRAGKEGYFAGARTVYAKADKANYLTIR